MSSSSSSLRLLVTEKFRGFGFVAHSGGMNLAVLGVRKSREDLADLSKID